MYRKFKTLSPKDCSVPHSRIAALQYHLDPHKRSTSLHNCHCNPIPSWRGEEWYGHVTLQQGHFITSSVDHWLAQYNAQPPRTVIEDEANYEQLKYASMTRNVPGWLARQSAWQSQIGGAAGYTYGGQGIWWACYNRSYVNGNCGPNDPPGTPPARSGSYRPRLVGHTSDSRPRSRRPRGRRRCARGRGRREYPHVFYGFTRKDLIYEDTIPSRHRDTIRQRREGPQTAAGAGRWT